MISRQWYTLSKRLASASVPARNAVIHAEEKISRLPNGLTVASVDLGGPIAQLVVAYRAGTRYEMPDEAGLVHQIRNCVGGDSQRYYGAQLLWQCGSAGANVAAFRNGSLGNYLYAKKKSIGKFSHRKMEKFAASQMVTGNAVLVGVNIPHDHVLDYAGTQFTLPEGNSISPKPSPYYGGEKRNKSLIKEAHVAIAGRGASLKNLKSLAVQAILSAAIGQSAAAKYAVGQGTVTKAVFKASSGYPFGISAISEVYADEGLVGVYIVSEADHIGPLCDAAIKALKSFTIDDSAFQAAKNIATMNVLNRAESAENMALDRAAQILATGEAGTVSDLLREIASISMDDITKAADQMKSKLTLASYGNIYQVPYLDQL
ncbi:unnamed protein product [Onchocerca flexuosa]|uniref:Peptidase_M16_C domain-containing protein n=1 Tax=Onchocerca flexuosa TaxID=387005 RepID=A0A183I0K0_9BILA|nr:unnamed protein product [Onchocerca flexuosa]